ncbi:SdpI family protein [Aquipuribacter sp. MA13-6]|uniref:SdpI family protein n=1 Tax=unclassified Aquipuribacter TaxID=2635084 RepID=UPI003EF03D63
MTEEAIARLVLVGVMLGSGALLLWMSQAAASGRLRRNPVAGIRVAATMASDEAWLVGHRRAKRPTQLAGWCAIASGVPAALPVALPIVVGSVLVGAVLMLAFVVYAAAVGSSAARAVVDVQ